MDAFHELEWRGLVYDCVEGVPDLLAQEKVTVYNGFDATADSLHIGHLVPLMGLARLQRFGHHPIALAGGGTSLIGDPSGRTGGERQLVSKQEIEKNVQSIKGQLAHLLDFEVKSNPAYLLNNADWLLSLNLVDFLRDVGKHFKVNAMIAKDSVRTRLEREDGISFTEFSYMLLQSYDFLHLYDTLGCRMQTGGSDQWGNITTGVELIRRMRDQAAYALVYPLITKADGSKFGKTESGSVWLSSQLTSPYRFYQFWMNTDDRDVISYLKYFTWLSQDEILELENALAQNPEQRLAQRALARAMTRMLHDENGLQRAEMASQVLFGGEIGGLTAAEIADIFADVPSSRLPKSQLEGALSIVELLVSSGVSKSKGEARRSIEAGGISLNNHRVADAAQPVTTAELVDGQYLVLRTGKKNYHLVKVY
jgi:tyrosyl-tRNA synthetase